MPTLPVAWLVPLQAVLEEVAEELGPPAESRPGDLGPADSRRRQGPLDGVDGVVIELVVLLGRPPPVEDVRLVPDLPVPLLDLGPAVALDAVG